MKQCNQLNINIRIDMINAKGLAQRRGSKIKELSKSDLPTIDPSVFSDVCVNLWPKM